jgi:PKD repeat protein
MEMNCDQNPITNMTTTVRSILFASAMVLSGASSAQLQYAATVYGVVQGCTPGQQITVSSSAETVTATLDIWCSYSAVVYTGQNPDVITTSTPCQGSVQTVVSNVTFNTELDSAMVYVTFNCGGNAPDCLGVPGGPNVPGSPCNDNDPATQNDAWTPDCQCVGDASSGCQAQLAISGAPWTFTAISQSTGVAPLSVLWTLPDGTTSAEQNPSYTFNAPGTYSLCLTITAGNGCTSTTCDTLFVNSLGWVDFTNTISDCLGILNGPNLPGAPCTIPGTTLEGTWSMTCQCDTNTVLPFDCLGLINGPNLPGTPCTEPATGLTGSWTSDCACEVDTTSTDCQANFWVLQAYTTSNEGDTTTTVPIPNEIWVWNLTSGGVAPYMYLWNFGDGTPASLDPYPTHVYASGGSYLLCLTIADASGCTSIHCDTITVDENGMYNGMIIDGRPGMLRNGFTLNVIAELPTAVAERNAVDEVALWPNPVEDVIGLSFHSMRSGSLQLMVVDANGRVVATSNQVVNNGANRHVFDVSDLESGLYLLLISDGTQQSSRRFVKN